MKIKLDSIEALAKAHAGLGAHFAKMADHHDGLSKAHGEHAAFMKGKHDAMADDDMHKAYFGKAADHHDGLQKMHKAMSEHYSGMADEHGDKAVTDQLGKKDEKVVPVVVADASIGNFLQKSMTEVMAEMGQAADFKGMIKEFLTASIKEQLGQTVMPMLTRATGTTTDPAKALELIPRPGEELPKGLEKAVEPPATLAHFFA